MRHRAQPVRGTGGMVNFTIGDFGGGGIREQRRHWNTFKFTAQKGPNFRGASFFLGQAIWIRSVMKHREQVSGP
jgi:hypothetical protein